MNCRRQALQLCLNLAVVVVIEILYEFLFAVLHGLRLLQIQQFTLEQTKETLNHGIAQTVAFLAHTLPNAFHHFILLMPVLTALVIMKDQIDSIRYFLKSLVQYGRHYAHRRPVRNGIAYQIAAMQIKNRREVRFLSKQAELRYIHDSLLISRLHSLMVQGEFTVVKFCCSAAITLPASVF